MRSTMRLKVAVPHSSFSSRRLRLTKTRAPENAPCRASADPAGCEQAPGPHSSHRNTAPAHARAGTCTDRRYLRVSRRSGVPRHLEALDLVRLEPVRLPDALWVSLTPATAADVRALHCVAPGLGCMVRRTISAASTLGSRLPRRKSISIAINPPWT